MFTLALVTYAAAPTLTPDDQLLQHALTAAGVRAEAVRWDDAANDWGRFDAILIRSTWDYFLRMDEFAPWLSRIEALGVPVWNPMPMLRWNSNKRYLVDLRDAGILTVPTTFIEPGARNRPTLHAILAAEGWTDAVVKPAISGGGRDTWRTSVASAGADEARLHELWSRAPGGVMVQPFVGEIDRDGEWSLVFLDGAFSHATIKRARSGDFRVQQEHGGTYAAASPSPGIVHDAARVVAAGASRAGLVAADLAYARVDGVVTERSGMHTLMLMELECIEPSLFFCQVPDAAERMALALVSRYRTGRTSTDR